MPSLGPAGRGGARRRTRRRMSRRMNASSPEPQAEASDNSSEDPMDQLKKLGELHQAGVISDEEFAEKKAKLMDQI